MVWSIFAWSGKHILPFFFFFLIFTFSRLLNVWPVRVPFLSPARDENKKTRKRILGDQLMTVSIMIYSELQVRGKFATCVDYGTENRADNG